MFRFAAGRMLQPLVEEASKKGGKIAKAIGDGTYDTESNFLYLAMNGIEAVIKVRKNASSRDRRMHTTEACSSGVPPRP